MEIPKGWEVKTLESSTMNDENITLNFVDAATIEAGVPYMVRTTETVLTITGNNVWLNTELHTTNTTHVSLIGVYAPQNIPLYSYFISSNKFYRSVSTSNPDKIKSYRAFITPIGNSANARSIGYLIIGRDGEEDATQIDEQVAEEATVGSIHLYHQRHAYQ